MIRLAPGGPRRPHPLYARYLGDEALVPATPAELGRAVEAAVESERERLQGVVDAALASLPADPGARVFEPARAEYRREGDVWRLRVTARSRADFEELAALGSRGEYNRPWSDVAGGTYVYAERGALPVSVAPVVQGGTANLDVAVNGTRVQVAVNPGKPWLERQILEPLRSVGQVGGAVAVGVAKAINPKSYLPEWWPDLEKYLKAAGLLAVGVIGLMVLNLALPKD